ncbi:hypothetical protein STSO111631_12880 [Stackebrandtia soli]
MTAVAVLFTAGLSGCGGTTVTALPSACAAVSLKTVDALVADAPGIEDSSGRTLPKGDNGGGGQSNSCEWTYDPVATFGPQRTDAPEADSRWLLGHSLTVRYTWWPDAERACEAVASPDDGLAAAKTSSIDLGDTGNQSRLAGADSSRAIVRSCVDTLSIVADYSVDVATSGGYTLDSAPDPSSEDVAAAVLDVATEAVDAVTNPDDRTSEASAPASVATVCADVPLDAVQAIPGATENVVENHNGEVCRWAQAGVDMTDVDLDDSTVTTSNFSPVTVELTATTYDGDTAIAASDIATWTEITGASAIDDRPDAGILTYSTLGGNGATLRFAHDGTAYTLTCAEANPEGDLLPALLGIVASLTT